MLQKLTLLRSLQSRNIFEGKFRRSTIIIEKKGTGGNDARLIAALIELNRALIPLSVFTTYHVVGVGANEKLLFVVPMSDWPFGCTHPAHK